MSVLGSQISRLAYPLLVLAITGSAARAGYAEAAATLPYLLFPLLAGAYADRTDRRRLMIWCDVLRLLAVASVGVAVVAGGAVFEVVLLAGFVEGVGTVYYSVADRGSVPMLVHESQQAAAVAQNEARTYGAQLAGAAVGGALFEMGRVLPFIVDAVSYVASLFTLAMIRAPMQEADTTRSADTGGLRRDLAEGLRITLRHPFLRMVSILAAVVNICLQVLILAIIVLARADGATATQTGAAVACMGIGGLAGSFAAPWVQRRIRPGLIITGAIWTWAVLLALLAAIRSPIWLLPVTAAVGVAEPLWNVAARTYRLRLVPNRLLARVSSVSLQIGWGTVPIGSLLAAILLGAMSPALVLVILSVSLGVTAAAATMAGSVRRAGGAADISPETKAG